MSSAPEDIDKHVLKRYEIIQKLGKGAYGVVWKAIDRKSKEVIAIKKVFDAFQNSTDSQRTYREVMFLHELAHHDNVVTLLNVMRPSIENIRDLYLVFEYMQTDLHNVIRAKMLTRVHRQYISYQLFSTMQYLHDCKIIHRDLKPSNILINSDCKIKLADFGLARLMTSPTTISVTGSVTDSSGNYSKSVTMTDYVATRWYRAPEILLGSHSYDFAVDMWSCGCILAEMLIFKPLFPGTSTMNQISKIINLIGAPSEHDVQDIKSKYAENMLSKFGKQNVRMKMSTVEAAKTYQGNNFASDLNSSTKSNHSTEGSKGMINNMLKRVVSRKNSKKDSPQSKRVNNETDCEDLFDVDSDFYFLNLMRMFPTAQKDEISLIGKLLRFGPKYRVSAAEAVHASFVKRFNDESRSCESDSDRSTKILDCICDYEIKMALDDNVKYSIQQYREKLYNEIDKRSRDTKMRVRRLQEAL